VAVAADRGDTGARPRETPRDEGSEPDPRFTFANERTFLAWNRTSLALIGGGLAVARFLDIGGQGVRLVVALPLIILGVGTSLVSLRRWRGNERALRHDEPLPSSRLPSLLVIGVAVVGLAAVALAIVAAVVGHL
jgi:putative membrane protein